MFDSLFCVGDCCEVTVFCLAVGTFGQKWCCCFWLLEHRCDRWSRVHPNLLFEPQTQTRVFPDEVLNFRCSRPCRFEDLPSQTKGSFFSHATDSLGSCTPPFSKVLLYPDIPLKLTMPYTWRNKARRDTTSCKIWRSRYQGVDGLFILVRSCHLEMRNPKIKRSTNPVLVGWWLFPTKKHNKWSWSNLVHVVEVDQSTKCADGPTHILPPKTYYPWRFFWGSCFPDTPIFTSFSPMGRLKLYPKMISMAIFWGWCCSDTPIKLHTYCPRLRSGLWPPGSCPWNQIFHLFQTGHSIRSWSLSIVELCWTFIPDCCVSWHDILMLITSHMTGSCIWVCFVVRFVVCLVSHQVKASPRRVQTWETGLFIACFTRGLACACSTSKFEKRSLEWLLLKHRHKTYMLFCIVI